MKRLGLFVLLLSYSASSFAAIETFGDKASVGKFFIEAPGYNLDFKSEDNPTNLKFRPNVAATTGVSVSFLGLFGFGYGFRAPIAEEEKTKKGKSVYDDFRFSFGYEEMKFDINFQSYRGFYIENPDSYDTHWASSDPYYQDPDMKLENLSANFTYITSPDKFSLSAPLDQTVRQTESGGSLLLGASVANTIIKSPNGLIPPLAAARFGGEATLSEAAFLAFTVKAGYGYSFIFAEKWYATLTGMVGPGFQVATVKNATDTKDRQDLSYKLDALLGLGYNGDTLIAGLINSVDATGFQTATVDISSQLIKSNLFVGGRF